MHDSANWFALAVYSVTALVVSELAARSRRRAADAEQREREASLLAEIAGRLLGGRPLEAELGWVGEQAADGTRHSREPRSSSSRNAGAAADDRSRSRSTGAP